MSMKLKKLSPLRVFRRMDDNNSGDLNKEEFIKGIRDTGLQITDEDADKLFDRFDKDNSGTVHYEEFLKAVRVSLLRNLLITF